MINTSALKIETLAGLIQLVGEYEFIRLELKSSKMFYDWQTMTPKKKDEYTCLLSKEISGLANTEGGHIIIGFTTEKVGKEPDKAVKLDQGISFKDFSPESIQRAVEASISPPLPGLRFIPIKTEYDENRYYLVIEVPKGSTAHQAKDKLYYGRSEFETTALHDSVIRLLMNKRREPYAIARFESTQDRSLIFPIQVYIQNLGEITIQDFKLSLSLEKAGKLKILAIRTWFEDEENPSSSTYACSEIDYHFRDGWPAPQFSGATDVGVMLQETGGYFTKPSKLQVCIYPKDRFWIGQIGISNIKTAIDVEQVPEEAELVWKVYLRDASPTSGRVSLKPLLIPFFAEDS